MHGYKLLFFICVQIFQISGGQMNVYHSKVNNQDCRSVIQEYGWAFGPSI